MDRETARPKRVYRQVARAQAAEVTAARILDAFESHLRELWYDEVTLDLVARDAGVTVPTVLRRFGSKEGLLEALWQRLADSVLGGRQARPGDVGDVVRAVVADYDRLGDLVLRILAQESRFPSFRQKADIGRTHHRGWVERMFAAHLDALPARARRQALDALVVATDLYTWKLVRRDMGRSAADTRQVMAALVEGALAVAAER
ncbi:MAG TPA: helix-turn-helix domain-containing protein [Lysobacter sp.]|nr:helix-turn-helix domain-containing protein [Lysobacter sp.]